MSNFWLSLPQPFLVQAPMEGVTDTVFRQMLIVCGRPDVFFTEFTNVDGIFSAGRSHAARRLMYSPEERPLVAQIWGHKPENYYHGARMIRAKGFDGVDINMGCPQKDIVRKGLCSALIENRELASAVIRATQDGAGKHFPVSVKTRIGIQKPVTEDWIKFLLSHDLAAVTIHARTVKEMSKAPAHWDEIKKAVQMRDATKKRTVIIGNGDVKSRPEALERISQTGVDGVMIGRGLLEDVFVFQDTFHPISPQQRMTILTEHIDRAYNTWGNDTHFSDLKKYIKVYIRDFDQAAALRETLMRTTSIESLKVALEKPIAQK